MSRCCIDRESRARGGECFESESSGSRRRYVEIRDQFLKFLKSLFADNRVASALTCTVVHHVSQRCGPELANLSPSCIGGRFRRGLRNQQSMNTGPCLDLHIIAQGVFGMFALIFQIAFNGMIMKRSMTAANAEGILTDPVTSETDRSAIQGVFFCRALAIILEPTRWLKRWFFRRATPVMRTTKLQAGRIPPVCDTVNMLFLQDSGFFSIAIVWRQVRRLAWL